MFLLRSPCSSLLRRRRTGPRPSPSRVRRAVLLKSASGLFGNGVANAAIRREPADYLVELTGNAPLSQAPGDAGIRHWPSGQLTRHTGRWGLWLRRSCPASLPPCAFAKPQIHFRCSSRHDDFPFDVLALFHGAIDRGLDFTHATSRFRGSAHYRGHAAPGWAVGLVLGHVVGEGAVTEDDRGLSRGRQLDPPFSDPESKRLDGFAVDLLGKASNQGPGADRPNGGTRRWRASRWARRGRGRASAAARRECHPRCGRARYAQGYRATLPSRSSRSGPQARMLEVSSLNTRKPRSPAARSVPDRFLISLRTFRSRAVPMSKN